MNDSANSPEPRLRALFLQALEIANPAERDQFLGSACGNDPELREQVKALLAQHKDDSFLEPPRAPAGSLVVGAEAVVREPGEIANRQSPIANPLVRYFGDYELLEEIARGGMGVVYKARQVSLNRVVAVKMILAGNLASEADVKRFHTEAEAAANLQHPNIVAIHEVGEHEGQHYFSMDYVEGRNLAAVVGEGPLPAARAAQLVKTIAEAIQYAHLRGVCHRDLKPQNVMVDQSGRPRVTDFGLAKRGGVESDLTMSGAIMGSPSYMSPEQAQGRQDLVGPQSDIYSQGAILYELLTRRPPFRGETPLVTLAKVVAEEPTRPSKLSPGVPRDLESICLKCLEKRPERRYASAHELVEDLNRFLEQRPVLARPASRARKAWSWSQRHPWVLSGAMTACLLVAVLTACGFWERTRYLAWQAANPDQQPPLELNFLILTWLFGFCCFADLNRLAKRDFEQRLVRQLRNGNPIANARLLCYALLGVGMSAYAVLLLLEAVHLWAWEAPARLGLGWPLVSAGFLTWNGASWLWRALGAHETATFRHLVERQVDPQPAGGAETVRSPTRRGISRTQAWALVVSELCMMLVLGCSPIGWTAAGLMVTGFNAGALPILWLGSPRPASAARRLLKWACPAIALALLAAVNWRWKRDLSRFANIGAFMGMFVAALFLSSRRTRLPRGTSRGTDARSVSRGRGIVRAAVACASLALFAYATARTCSARWALVKYQALFTAPGERPDWRLPKVADPPAELNFAKTPTLEAIAYGRQEKWGLWARLESTYRALGSPWAVPWPDLGGIRKRWKGVADGAYPTRLTPAQGIQAALRGVEAELNELRVASRRPFAQLDLPPADYGPLWASYSSSSLNLVAWRVLAGLVALDAGAALESEESERAAEDFHALVQMAALLTGPLQMADGAFRVAVVQTALQVLWDGCQARRWSAEQLTRLQSDLGSIDLLRDLDNRLRFGERVAFNAQLEQQWGPMQCLPIPWFQEGMLLYNQVLHDHLLACYSVQQHRVYVERMAGHDSARRRELQRASSVARTLTIALPNFDKPLFQITRAQAFVDLALVVCALERHRFGQGDYPTRLDALRPAYLARLPHDIITGRPLKYRRMEDGHFLLYSVGWDGVDDGGSAQREKPGQDPKDWVWVGAAQ